MTPEEMEKVVQACNELGFLIMFHGGTSGMIGCTEIEGVPFVVLDPAAVEDLLKILRGPSPSTEEIH